MFEVSITFQGLKLTYQVDQLVDLSIGGVLIFHTISIRESEGKFKLRILLRIRCP